MDLKVFQRLTENISNNKQLESLPYCHKTISPGGSEEFSIISGHHRVRAARKAGFTEIFVLVDNNDLTPAQVKAKQLAHNSLSGKDDAQVLAEIFASIDELSARLESGISDLSPLLPAAQAGEDLTIELPYEQVMILFLPYEFENFSTLLRCLESDLKGSRLIGLAGLDQFDSYRNMIQAVMRRHDVRNIAGIMAKVTEIVQTALRESADTGK